MVSSVGKKETDANVRRLVLQTIREDVGKVKLKVTALSTAIQSEREKKVQHELRNCVQRSTLPPVHNGT